MGIAISNLQLVAPTSQKRIVMIDAMRGFALFGILLLHMNDNFSISGELLDVKFHYPNLDPIVHRVTQILFRSKASTLFSLFLGYGFWIQFSNHEKKGYDFGLRYMWRLVLLLGIGILHALFFSGDILVLYALIGGVVVITRHWKDQYIFALSIFLLFNPFELYHLFKMGFFGETRYLFEGYDQSVALGNTIKNNGTLWEVVGYNLRYNILNNLISNLENGRVLRFASVFLLGVLACKREVLKINKISFWVKAFWISLLSYGLFHFIERYISRFMSRPDMLLSLDVIVSGIQSLFFTLAIMAVFATVWIYFSGRSWLNLLIPFGKMSLTNYVTQGIIGTFLFYGYGLNLSSYFGASWCVILSIAFFLLQVAFSSYYLKHHKSGPLETIWRKLTWIDRKQ